MKAQWEQGCAMLIVFGGLPGTGKSTLARMLAEGLGATYLRIDTIERAITESNHAIAVRDDGYRVAYAVAADNFGWVARLSGMQSILCASHVTHGVDPPNARGQTSSRSRSCVPIHTNIGVASKRVLSTSM